MRACLPSYSPQPPSVMPRKAAKSKVSICLRHARHTNVIPAQSGQEALKLFQAHPVDLVILDYWMSGLNGVSVAREMGETETADLLDEVATLLKRQRAKSASCN